MSENDDVTELDLRMQALQFAMQSSISGEIDEIISRAEAYLKFLKGNQNG